MLGLLLVVGLGYYLFVRERKAPDVVLPEAQVEVVISPEEETNVAVVGESEVLADNLVLVEVKATNFAYDVTTINATLGDTVKLTLINEEGVHDLVLPEFGVAVEPLEEGEQASVEWVAAKPGEFEYYCSVGNHRELGMVGTLVVSE